MAARNAYWGDFSAWCASEGVAYVDDDRRAVARQAATELVVETGDVLLEMLIVTATESLDRPKPELRRDERRLGEALADLDAIKSCWAFLTYAMAARSAVMSYESGEELAESIHREAARLVASYWPRSEDDERVIDAGFEASKLGYWSLEWVYTHHGLGCLLGEAIDELALFNGLDPLLDLAKLSVAWNTGFERYEYVLERVALNG